MEDESAAGVGGAEICHGRGLDGAATTANLPRSESLASGRKGTMVSTECACELDWAIAPEFDIQPVPEFDEDEDGEAPGVSLEEEPVNWEPIFNDGALGLVADAGRDRDEEADDSDFGFDDFDNEPDDDDLDDDFEDDDEDLDDDLDDLDDDDDL
jgi:hypothetical protein